uniref:inhibitor of growth protein 5 n=1 Tax=Halichoerus grypus TaxID=9711 RepID=UPI0016599FD6|nr:inhibitor of growth protein 5 [Halichoerus grypus]
MATAMYLEHYLDSIENLPCELQRNFQLMRELDQRTEDKKAEIDILAAEYISTVKTLSPDQRVEHLQKIQSAYSKCKEYSDDKVQLAMQTYEMVRRWGAGRPGGAAGGPGSSLLRGKGPAAEKWCI